MVPPAFPEEGTLAIASCRDGSNIPPGAGAAQARISANPQETGRTSSGRRRGGHRRRPPPAHRPLEVVEERQDGAKKLFVPKAACASRSRATRFRKFSNSAARYASCSFRLAASSVSAGTRRPPAPLPRPPPSVPPQRLPPAAILSPCLSSLSSPGEIARESGRTQCCLHKYSCIRGPLHPPRLRCAPSPYFPSTPRSRTPCGCGASDLSVPRRICESNTSGPRTSW